MSTRKEMVVRVINYYVSVVLIKKDNKSVVIRGYMASLIALKELLNEQISKAELKELVPVLLVSITCHTGLHYWTSKESRDAAKGEGVWFVVIKKLLFLL